MNKRVFNALRKIASGTQLVYKSGPDLPLGPSVLLALAASYRSRGKKMPITEDSGYGLAVHSSRRLDDEVLRQHVDKLVALDTLKQIVDVKPKLAQIDFYKKHGPAILHVGDPNSGESNGYIISPEISSLSEDRRGKILAELSASAPELSMQLSRD